MIEKNTSVIELENENIFDFVFDDLVKNDCSYIIHRNENYNEPLAVLMPVKYVELLNS